MSCELQLARNKKRWLGTRDPSYLEIYSINIPINPRGETQQHRVVREHIRLDLRKKPNCLSLVSYHTIPTTHL